MKKTILFLIFLLLAIMANNLFAQGLTKKTLLSNEEFFEKADYILEGTVIPYDPIKGPDFYDALGNYDIEDLYTSYLIRVTYTYKVDSTFTIKRGDTINVIKKGGRIIKNADDPYNMEIINYFSQDRYESGVIQEPVWVGGEVIYFMKKNDLPLNPDSSKHNKYLKLTMLQDVKKGAIRIINHGFRITGLNDLSFGSRYELYKYMKQMDSTLNIPLKNVNKMREDLSYDKGAWEIYLKEQNIKIKETNNKEHIDSLNNFLERKAKQAKENSEKKKKDKEQ